MPIGDILPEIALIIGAACLVLCAAFLPQHRQSLCAGLGLVFLVLALALTAAQWGRVTVTFNGVWTIDRAAVYVKLLILAITVFTVLISPAWFRQERRLGEYYGLLLFAALGSIMMASAHDAMELVMGALLSSAASYPLVAYHRAWSPSVEAGMKYFLLGALANVFLVLGVVLLFGAVGDTAYTTVSARLESGEPDVLIVTAAAVAIVLGLSFKLAAFPFYTWMPDVAQGAPVPVAAFLSVTPKIGAAIALSRLGLMLSDFGGWVPLMVILSGLTMTLGNLGALWQNDVRRLLGWSSISQTGYALMAVAVIADYQRAMPALLMFLSAYSIANMAAFAVICNLRGRTRLDDFAGLARQQPLAASVLILCFFSLVGIPPLVGFFGKMMLFTTVIDAGQIALAVIALLNTVCSLYYYLRVMRTILFDSPGATVARLDGVSHGVTLILGVLILLAGLGARTLVVSV